MPQHEDLELLRTLRSAQQHDQLKQPAERDIDERPNHARPPKFGKGQAIDLRAEAAPRARTEFLNPTRLQVTARPRPARDRAVEPLRGQQILRLAADRLNGPYAFGPGAAGRGHQGLELGNARPLRAAHTGRACRQHARPAPQYLPNRHEADAAGQPLPEAPSERLFPCTRFRGSPRPGTSVRSSGSAPAASGFGRGADTAGPRSSV